MKGFRNVLLGPLAARLGSVAGGAVASWATLDPSLSSRVEAWVAAGAFIAIDLVVAYFRRSNAMEGR